MLTKKIIFRFLKEVKEKWYWILIVAILYGGYGVYKTYHEIPYYSASIEFMTNERLNWYDQYLLQKELAKLAQTRDLWLPILFKKVKWGGSEDFVINYIIEQFELFKSSGLSDMLSEKNQKRELIGFRFTHSDISNFTSLEQEALNTAFNFSKMTVWLMPGMGTGKFTISSSMDNPFLPYFLVTHFHQALLKVYEQKVTESTEENTKELIAEINKKEVEIEQLEYALSKFHDLQGLVSNKSLLKGKRLERQLNREKTNLRKYENQMTKFITNPSNTTPITFMILNESDAFAPPRYAHHKLWYPLKRGAKGGLTAIVLLFVNLVIQYVRRVLKEAELDEQLKNQKAESMEPKALEQINNLTVVSKQSFIKAIN